MNMYLPQEIAPAQKPKIHFLQPPLMTINTAPKGTSKGDVMKKIHLDSKQFILYDDAFQKLQAFISSSNTKGHK